MAARLMVKRGGTDPKQILLASQIVTTTERATQILNDVLDVTLAAFGTDIPVVKAPMDMGRLAIQIVEELRIVSNGRDIEISIVGETDGEWDKARIGQALSNLIGNALQYSPEYSVVHVTVAGQENNVLVTVHNNGDPILAGKIKVIFEAFTRGQRDAAPGRAANLGLALYITKRIVLAHQGEISAMSAVEAGTTFIVRLPRH